VAKSGAWVGADTGKISAQGFRRIAAFPRPQRINLSLTVPQALIPKPLALPSQFFWNCRVSLVYTRVIGKSCHTSGVGQTSNILQPIAYRLMSSTAGVVPAHRASPQRGPRMNSFRDFIYLIIRFGVGVISLAYR